MVLSHGDFCLPNLFGIHEKVTGYIDLGIAGITQTRLDFDEMLLFRELGIEPGWEKIRYYILLDELF